MSLLLQKVGGILFWVDVYSKANVEKQALNTLKTGFTSKVLFPTSTLQKITLILYRQFLGNFRPFHSICIFFRFTTHSNLKVHLASLHTGIMPYNCSFCQKGFTRKKTKDIHETKCTNVQKNTSDITAKQKHQGIVIVPEPSPYITNMGDMIL